MAMMYFKIIDHVKKPLSELPFVTVMCMITILETCGDVQTSRA